MPSGWYLMVWLSTSTPDFFPIIRSVRTRSTGWAFMKSRAFCGSQMVSIRHPSFESISFMTSHMYSSSSTTRICEIPRCDSFNSSVSNEVNDAGGETAFFPAFFSRAGLTSKTVPLDEQELSFNLLLISPLLMHYGSSKRRGGKPKNPTFLAGTFTEVLSVDNQSRLNLRLCFFCAIGIRVGVASGDVSPQTPFFNHQEIHSSF